MKTLVTALAILGALQEGAVELRWKFRKGQELRYRAVRKVTMDLGGGQGPSQESSTTWRMTVTDVDAQGTATMTVRYDAVAVKASGAGLQEFDYDSEKDKKLPEEPSARMEALLVGQSFTMRMTALGKVTEVRGCDAILEGVFKRAGVGEEQETAREVVRQMYSDEGMKARMGQMSPGLPEKKVAAGDSWTAEYGMKVPPVGTLKFAIGNRLRELKEKAAHIDQDVRIELKPEEGGSLVGSTQIKDLKGAASTLFGVERGLFLSSRAQVTFIMSAGGQDIPMKIEASLSLLE